jgi:hypothetical protein
MCASTPKIAVAAYFSTRGRETEARASAIASRVHQLDRVARQRRTVLVPAFSQLAVEAVARANAVVVRVDAEQCKLQPCFQIELESNLTNLGCAPRMCQWRDWQHSRSNMHGGSASVQSFIYSN